MTRKDYTLIAQAIAKVEHESWHHLQGVCGRLDCKTEETLLRTVEALADALAADKPARFNRAKFIDATGIQTKIEAAHSENLAYLSR
jgi:hypothetical protein